MALPTSAQTASRSVTKLSAQRATGWPMTSQSKGPQPVFITTAVIQIRISAAAKGGNASRATMSRRLAVQANRIITQATGTAKATTAASATSEPAATRFQKAD